jgi:outer membrane protein
MSPSTLLLVSAALASQPRAILLEEALDLAAVQSPRVLVAEQEVVAARAGAHSVRSYLLPTLSLEGNALWWDEASEVPYSEFLAPLTGGDACADLEEYLQEFCQDFMDGMVGGLEGGITLRDAHTRQVTARVVQPLTGLYGIEEGWRAARSMERAAEAALDGVGADVALEVVEAWFGAAEVARLEAVAAQAVEALEAHQVRAAAFYEAGLIGRNEIMQLEVALSEARLGRGRAAAGVALTRRHLALVTGTQQRSLVPSEVDLEQLPALGLQTAALRARAERVPQVRALEAQRDAALANRNRLHAERIPQIAAIAQYEQNWGLGSLAIPESWFVGLGMEWELWAWGRKHYDAQQAAALARQAEIGLEAMRDGMSLQAEAMLSEAELALQARESRRVSTGQAAENLRILRAKFEAHTATATDLLEAETLHTKATTDEIVAAFDYLVAIARLQHALGMPIDPMGGLVVAPGAPPR